MSNMEFEEWRWERCAVELKNLHSDNYVFTDEIFREECK